MLATLYFVLELQSKESKVFHTLFEAFVFFKSIPSGTNLNCAHRSVFLRKKTATTTNNSKPEKDSANDNRQRLHPEDINTECTTKYGKDLQGEYKLSKYWELREGSLR